jgi:hypothetical protein
MSVTQAAVRGTARKLLSIRADETRLNASAGRKKWRTAALRACRRRCRSIPPGLKNRQM